MQLNKFTDYGLRILLYIARPREDVYTITELAKNLQVSQNHLVKIVHFMAKQQWLITVRGRGGGIRLHPQVLDIPLGEIVRILQDDPQIINCANPPCVLRSNCGLKPVLDQALLQFYQSLNQYTLQQFIPSNKPAVQKISLTNILTES